MRRKSPPKSAANVALFPFLAVLLCTMGALILLLVVIARQAQQQAAALAAGTSDQQKVAQEAIEDLEWAASQLRGSREKFGAQLAEERMKLSHIEDHTRRLRDQIAELAAAAEKLQQTDQLDQKGRERKLAELAKLSAKLAKGKSDLDNALAANKGNTEAYAIIPFAGRNGTRRRPIYIECRADGVILQPEGIKLTENDFILSDSPANPLATSLRAAREYLSRKRRMDDAHRRTLSAPVGSPRRHRRLLDRSRRHDVLGRRIWLRTHRPGLEVGFCSSRCRSGSLPAIGSDRSPPATSAHRPTSTPIIPR